LVIANARWSSTPELLSLPGSRLNSANASVLPTALSRELDARFREKLLITSVEAPQSLGIAMAVGGKVQRARLNLIALPTEISEPGKSPSIDPSNLMVWLSESAAPSQIDPVVTDAMRRYGTTMRLPWAYVDAKGIYVYLNPQALALLGPDADDVIGHHFEQWAIDKPGRSVGAEFIRRGLNGETLTYDRLRFDHRFGSDRWHRVEITPDADANGKVMGAFLASHDVDEKKAAEAMARSAINQLDLHLKRGPLIAIELDGERRVMSWSRQAEELLGYAANEAIGRTIRELGTVPDIDMVETRINELIAHQSVHSWRHRNANRAKNGETVWIDWFDSVVRDAVTGQVSVLCIGIDVTQELALKERLTVVATYDALTGLLNLQAITMVVDAKIKSGNRFAFMLFDLDAFKQINDYRGHTVGDQLLVALANRIRRLLEPGERVARFGGDEFAVLLNLPEAYSEAALNERARILLQYISEPFKIDFEFSVTASAGIAVPPDTGGDSQSLILNADIAMYRAKADGRNRAVLFTKTLGEEGCRRLERREALRKAVREATLDVHYQPVFDAVTDRVVGAEALARWTFDGEEITPVYFIPLAEEAGFIHELWACVMHKACVFAARINGVDRPWCPIAVNVSPLQLKDSHFDQHVLRVLKETACKPGWVSLEVTESATLGEDDTAATLRKLGIIGVRCGVDDFGTGYSNFAHLKRLPLSTLKIDKSFVRDISRGDSAIVHAIVTMAHSLGLRVVAEGVQYIEELSALKQMGCDFYQGFISSAAVPDVDIEAMVASDQHWVGGDEESTT
jgi:diguanylate cyclase (GGDEF)-like protein/PAS domain S-box-containing protein